MPGHRLPAAAGVPPVRGSEPRLGLARLAGTAASLASRALGKGAGDVIGGAVLLRLAPDAIADLAGERVLACVSATNGKTTTTRLLCAALSGAGRVVSNVSGANLPAGVATVLARRPTSRAAVLEVDEMFLQRLIGPLRPRVVVLLNLSRDQLDRTAETRALMVSWREALAGADAGRSTVVANCDDPLVAWAAARCPRVRWVSLGRAWRADAKACPECGNLLADGVGGDWHCPACGLCRPDPCGRVTGSSLWADDAKYPVSLALPGRANVRNAAMAAMAARELGVDLPRALAAMREVHDVAGRYAVLRGPDCDFWLLLAKNPAGWAEALDVLAVGSRPLVLAVNAQAADGRDTSWLYDVPFGRLSGRQVVVTGERAADLSLRLTYLGVAHRRVDDLASALAASGAERVDAVGNYTAFQQLRALGSPRGRA